MIFSVSSSFSIELSRGFFSIDIGSRHLSILIERRSSQVATKWIETIRESEPTGVQALWVAVGRWYISVNHGTLQRKACGVSGN